MDWLIIRLMDSQWLDGRTDRRAYLSIFHFTSPNSCGAEYIPYITRDMSIYFLHNWSIVGYNLVVFYSSLFKHAVQSIIHLDECPIYKAPYFFGEVPLNILEQKPFFLWVYWDLASSSHHESGQRHQVCLHDLSVTVTTKPCLLRGRLSSAARRVTPWFSATKKGGKPQCSRVLTGKTCWLYRRFREIRSPILGP